MSSSHNKMPDNRVSVVSFGFKNGNPPQANVVLDVRFLKNPFWVEELRPLTGRDAPVQKYVMEQISAQEFMGHLFTLVSQVMPAMFDTKTDNFTIALGCTGGQHRSVAVAEELAQKLQSSYPHYQISLSHRELDRGLDQNQHAEPDQEKLALQEGV